MTSPLLRAATLTGVHHLEFYVGNARQASYFYQKAFGFRQLAYSGPETGVRDRASYVLGQGDVRLVLTTGLTPDHPACHFVQAHGDGVIDIALSTTDATRIYEQALERGATGIQPPTVHEDEHGRVVTSRIATYGDTLHTFIEHEGYRGPFLPGFVLQAGLLREPSTGISRIDHVVGNVDWNQMNTWRDFYTRVLDFHPFAHFDDKDISTEFSALRSIVMASPDERIKFPINEPAEGRKQSQIEEYIRANGAPGVQHLALATEDIVSTIRALRANGVAFLPTPASYYDALRTRVGDLQEAIDELQELGILVDRDDRGYMLQIFTQPLEDRPTFFIEIIQRRGSESFGKGNFKALFESIEREQALRGNLQETGRRG